MLHFQKCGRIDRAYMNLHVCDIGRDPSQAGHVAIFVAKPLCSDMEATWIHCVLGSVGSMQNSVESICPCLVEVLKWHIVRNYFDAFHTVKIPNAVADVKHDVLEQHLGYTVAHSSDERAIHSSFQHCTKSEKLHRLVL